MKSIDRVKAAADMAGLAIVIREMPQSTRTAEEAAAACGTSVAQIVKSLLFRKAGNREPVLLLVSGKNRVDQSAIAGQLGEELERLDAQAVREITGFAIGGVAPMGSLTPLATFMDADLLGFETIWAAAGAPNAVFQTNPRRLAQAVGARIITMT